MSTSIPSSPRKRSWIREPFSGMSHSVGVILSIVGLVILLILAQGRPRYILAFAIYGGSLTILYTASALYHSLHVTERNASRLQRFDHSAIYLLIAGSYTPLCMVLMRGVWGWTLLGIEYGVALIGICATLFWRNAPDWVRVVLYACMGWLILIAFPALQHALPPAGVAWMIGGGIVYSIGAVVFATDWPHLSPGKFSAHDLWHLFVLGGSACHYVLVLRFVALAG